MEKLKFSRKIQMNKTIFILLFTNFCGNHEKKLINFNEISRFLRKTLIFCEIFGEKLEKLYQKFSDFFANSRKLRPIIIVPKAKLKLFDITKKMYMQRKK